MTQAMHYQPRIKTQADRILFFCIIAVGIVGAILLKLYTPTSTLRIWTPLTFDLVLQAAYAVVVLQVPLFQLREDRAGDTFYYVGLLLTLGSLAHTLYEFGQSRGTEQGSSDVISGFGIALATTIFGLLLRALVQHFRTDPVEVEAHAQNALRDAASKLTAELYSVVTDMGSFRQSMKQITEEGMQQTTETASKAMTQAADSFSSEVARLVTSLDSTFADFGEHAKAFSEISKTTVAALRGLASRIDKIEPPSNVVEVVFGPARDHMVRMAESLTAAAEGQRQQITRLGELTEVSVRAVSNLNVTIKSIEEGAVKSVEAMEVARTVQAQNVIISQEVASVLSALSEFGRRQQSALNDLEALLSTAIDKLHGSISRFADSQEKVSTEAGKSIAAFAEMASRHVGEIEGQLAQAREASRKLVRQVIDLADVVAEKLA